LLPKNNPVETAGIIGTIKTDGSVVQVWRFGKWEKVKRAEGGSSRRIVWEYRQNDMPVDNMG